MRVEVLYRNDPERQLTDPVLEPGARGFVLRVYRGDFLDILGGAWFDPKRPPWKVLHAKLPLMPFISLRWPFSKRGGYFGFKLYGVDSPNYRTFVHPSEVYEGSQACCFSIRPFATLEKG